MKRFFQKIVEKKDRSAELAEEKLSEGEVINNSDEGSRLRIAIRHKLKKYLPWLIAGGISAAGHLPLLKHREGAPIGEPRMALALAGETFQPTKPPSIKQKDENTKKWQERANKEVSSNSDYRQVRVENQEKFKNSLEQDKRDLLATLEAGLTPDMQKVVFEMMEYKDQGVQAKIIDKAHDNFMSLARFVDKALPGEISKTALDTLVQNYAAARLHTDERSSISDALACGLCDESANCDARAKDLMLAIAEHYPDQLDKTHVQIFRDHIRLAYKLNGKMLILDGGVSEIDKDAASKNKRNLILPLYEYLKSYAGKDFHQLKDVQILGPKKSDKKHPAKQLDDQTGLNIPFDELDLDDFAPTLETKNEESKKKENKTVEKTISKLLKSAKIDGELDVITYKKSLVLDDVEEILQSGELWRIKFAESIDDDGLKKLVEDNVKNTDTVLKLNNLNPLSIDQAKILSKANALSIRIKKDTKKDAILELFKVKALGLDMLGGYTKEVIEMIEENRNLLLLLLYSSDTTNEALIATFQTKAKTVGTHSDMNISADLARAIAGSEKRVPLFGKIQMNQETKRIIANGTGFVEFYGQEPDDELIELALSGGANIYYFDATQISDLYAKYLQKKNWSVDTMKSYKKFTPRALEIILPVRTNINNSQVSALDLQGLDEITNEMAVALTKNPEQTIRIKKPKLSRTALKTLLDGNKFIEIELDQEEVTLEQINWYVSEYGLDQKVEKGKIGLVLKNVQEMSDEAIYRLKEINGFGFYGYDKSVARLVQQRLDLVGAKKQ